MMVQLGTPLLSSLNVGSFRRFFSSSPSPVMDAMQIPFGLPPDREIKSPFFFSTNGVGTCFFVLEVEEGHLAFWCACLLCFLHGNLRVSFSPLINGWYWWYPAWHRDSKEAFLILGGRQMDVFYWSPPPRVPLLTLVLSNSRVFFRPYLFFPILPTPVDPSPPHRHIVGHRCQSICPGTLRSH